MWKNFAEIIGALVEHANTYLPVQYESNSSFQHEVIFFQNLNLSRIQGGQLRWKKDKIFDFWHMWKMFATQIGEFVKDDYTYVQAQFDTYNSFLWDIIFYAKQQKSCYFHFKCLQNTYIQIFCGS